MLEFVAGLRAEGQVHLIPPKLRGSRLRTGAPIVVDAKAIPYRDVEALQRIVRFAGGALDLPRSTEGDRLWTLSTRPPRSTGQPTW